MSGRTYEHFALAALWFPFTYGTLKDPLTCKEDGLLNACTASSTCPKIVHSDSANEAWGKWGILLPDGA